MKYKTIFLQAKPAVYETAGLLSGNGTRQSDAFIDGPELAVQCAAACNALDSEGYEVVTITEVSRGNYEHIHQSGAGWSMTHGLLITARR